MTPTEQVKMLREALVAQREATSIAYGAVGSSDGLDASDERAIQAADKKCNAALAATAEPALHDIHVAVGPEAVDEVLSADAPTYSAQQGEHDGCYGADDLRKVAEESYDYGRHVGATELVGMDDAGAVRAAAIDAIIAKAVGR